MSIREQMREAHGDFWPTLEEMRKERIGNSLAINPTDKEIVFWWKGSLYVTAPGQSIDPIAYPEPAEVLRAIVANMGQRSDDE